MSKGHTYPCNSSLAIEGLVHEKRRLAIEWTKWHIILANVFETNVQSCSLLVKVWFVA